MSECKHNPSLLPITDVIPHRSPRLWLSGVIEFTPNVSIYGFWRPGDDQFDGHFPGKPILQGVQQLEALAQLGCYAAMYSKPGELGVFLSNIDANFINPVFPGETLELRIELAEQKTKSVFRGVGTVAVNGLVTCESIIAGRIVSKVAYERILKGAKEQRAINK